VGRGGSAALARGKFFKLYQAELEAGRKPGQAFRDRGWAM